MAISDKTTLKTYFQTGDVPTELQFIDLIDTTLPQTIKGDLVTYSTLPAILSVGANTYILTADSTTATGLKWAAPASTGITIGTTSITGGATTQLLFNLAGVVSSSAGLTYSSGLFTVLGTTQQAKFAYNAGNRLDLTVGSTGNATFSLTGTTPKFTFSQGVNFSGNIDVSDNFIFTLNRTTAVVGTSPRFRFTGSNVSTQDVYAEQDYIYFTRGINVSWQSSFNAGIDFGAAVGSISSPLITMLNGFVGGMYFANAGTGLTSQIIFTNNSINTIRFNGSNNVGIGTGATVSARVHIISTTEQLRVGYDTSNFLSLTTASNGDLTIALTGTTPTVKFSTKVQLSDVDLILGTTTGTKIGTSTSQKLGFWNKTPVVQPTTSGGSAVVAHIGSTVMNENDTIGGYTIAQIVQALQTIGILA